jgi:hypothetical protein
VHPPSYLWHVRIAFYVRPLPHLFFIPYNLRDIATTGVYRGSLRFLTTKRFSYPIKHTRRRECRKSRIAKTY